jgi:AcrR family transcriptional regulator
MNQLETSDTRCRLLHAAARVIGEGGVRRLTLEAVAAAAGVSKGGLLYHFPSKDALVAGLVCLGLDDFDEAVARRQAAGTDWLAAYVDAALAPSEMDALGPALVGALAENPALLDDIRSRYRHWYAQARAKAGPTGVRTLLMLDGLFFHQLMGLHGLVPGDELAMAIDGTPEAG